MSQHQLVDVLCVDELNISFSNRSVSLNVKCQIVMKAMTAANLSTEDNAFKQVSVFVQQDFWDLNRKLNTTETETSSYVAFCEYLNLDSDKLTFVLILLQL